MNDDDTQQLPAVQPTGTAPAPYTRPDMRLPEFLALPLSQRIELIDQERAAQAAATDAARRARRARGLGERILDAIGWWITRPERSGGVHRVRRGERYRKLGDGDLGATVRRPRHG